MGKLVKNRKRTKTKMKKKSSSKPKSRSNPKKNSGAPENVKPTIIINDNDHSSSDQSEPMEIVYKIIRKVMRVNHIECEEKAIRKAQRALKKIESTGTEDEIEDAKETLQEAIREQQEAKMWMHPSDTIKKLSEILQDQIENEEDSEIIEMTREFILDAEDSLRFINQGQEDAFYYKLVRINKSLIDLKKSNYIINDSDSDNESINNLPMIEHQKMMEEEQSVTKTFIESQQLLEDSSDDNMSQSDEDSLDDGQKTPIAKPNSKPINVIQKQLDDALKELSPQEKISKMRSQAKVNNEKRKMQIKELNDKKEKSKTSSKLSKSSKISKKNDDKVEKKLNKVTKKQSSQNQYYILDPSSDTSDDISNNNPSKTDDNKNESDDNNTSDQSMNESDYSENDDSDDNSSTNSHDTEDNNNETSNKAAKQTTINAKRNFNVYYSIKLKVEKGQIPTQQLEKSLKEWYKQLLLMDPTLVIYEFEDTSPNTAIMSLKNMPSDFTIMKKYFNNINVKPNGGHTWFQVWLGHDESAENLLMNMKHWSSQSDTYIYKKRLQHKYTSKDYWLLWSTERMDTSALHSEISTLIKRYTKQEFNFSFNFTFVRKENQQNKDKTPSKWNKALVLEVKREEKDMLYPILGRIFSTSNNIKILGTDMRMIPMLNGDLPSHTKMKISHLISKQEQFLSTLMIKPCLHFNEIDYYNTRLKTTMRDIIMNLETLKTFNSKGEPMRIFQNVDYSSWHSCYVLTFPKHLEKEADDYISQLPAYLHYVYGNEVLIMLSAEGAVQAQRSKWDPETLRATSQLDLELDAVASESADKGWLPTLELETIEIDTSNIEWQTEIHNRATDADSISTFAPKNKELLNNDDQHDSDEESINENQTPNRKKSKIKQKMSEATNLVSPTPINESAKVQDHQTRESGDYDHMNTSRIMASDLGATL